MNTIPRIGLFIDGQYFYWMGKYKLGWKPEPVAIVDWLDANYGRVVDSSYYQIVPDFLTETLAGYQKHLQHCGFSVIAKAGGNEEECRKVSIRVELVTDMLVRMTGYDMIAILTGDREFVYPLQKLKTLGKTVLVMSTEGYSPAELRSVAGRNYVDLARIRSAIEQQISPSHDQTPPSTHSTSETKQ